MIVLHLQTFRQSRQSGSVTEVIFLELEGSAFPERRWSDFPVIILGWWTHAWLQLEVPSRREVQWRFMDGPYAATLTKGAGTVRSAQVYTCLLEAAERVVAHCDEGRMTSRDLELLRGNMSSLKANRRSEEDAGFALQFSFGRQWPATSNSAR